MSSVIVRHCTCTRRTNRAKVHAHSTLSLSVSCSNAVYMSTKTEKLSQTKDNMNGSLGRVVRD
jgi:hypothetical protein